MTKATLTTLGMATPEDLSRCLAALGIETKTHNHPPVGTVEEKMHLRGALPGIHCKTLYFEDKKGALWLCVVEESRRLNIRALSDLIGSARLSFARPERVITDLGVEPGAVTPFALINYKETKINIIFDSEVIRAETANFYPLVNNRTTAITPSDLLKLLAASGHHPRVLDLSIIKDHVN